MAGQQRACFECRQQCALHCQVAARRGRCSQNCACCMLCGVCSADWMAGSCCATVMLLHHKSNMGYAITIAACMPLRSVGARGSTTGERSPTALMSPKRTQPTSVSGCLLDTCDLLADKEFHACGRMCSRACFPLLPGTRAGVDPHERGKGWPLGLGSQMSNERAQQTFIRCTVCPNGTVCASLAQVDCRALLQPRSDL